MTIVPPNLNTPKSQYKATNIFHEQGHYRNKRKKNISGNLVEKKPINGEKLLTHHTSHAITQSLTNLTQFDHDTSNLNTQQSQTNRKYLPHQRYYCKKSAFLQNL